MSRTAEPQPELQAWLEQRQGLPAAEADQHARRLAHVFGGDQQAALAGRPLTFELCSSKGLMGLETAQLLARIAYRRHENVVSFETMAQRTWQLIDGHISAYVQRRQQQPNKRPPKHSCLAAKLRSDCTAVWALAVPPDHVEDWLATVSKLLPQADIGALLLTSPSVVTGCIDTASAAVAWASVTLEVEGKELMSLFAAMPGLLKRTAAALDVNFAALQETAQLTAEQARRMVLYYPALLTASSETVRAAAGWVRRHFPDAEQLLELLERCPRLLAVPADRLQRNASYLQHQLGWQPGSGQLAACIADYPLPFAQLDFEGKETQAKLLLLTGVVGVGRLDVLASGSNCLVRGLETIAARYMLVQVGAGILAGCVDGNRSHLLCMLHLPNNQPTSADATACAQERAPWMLFDASGGTSLGWANNAAHTLARHGFASTAEARAFLRWWPKSEDGQRLVAVLRWALVGEQGW